MQVLARPYETCVYSVVFHSVHTGEHIDSYNESMHTLWNYCAHKKKNACSKYKLLTRRLQEALVDTYIYRFANKLL